MLGGRITAKLLRQIISGFNVSPKRSILSSTSDYFDDEDVSSAVDDLPEDVKEGHFVVHTIDQGELNRFVLELDYLDHPEFLKLLEKAEDEFGFRTNGVLSVPCCPNVLQKIIEKKK